MQTLRTQVVPTVEGTTHRLPKEQVQVALLEQAEGDTIIS